MSDDCVLLAHGGGGELTRALIEDHIVPRLGNPALDPLTDAAVIAGGPDRLCLTTDASVVQPLEFPGGDIGRLAVAGTVNDLAVMGAEPLALMQTLVIEEGLRLATLDRILDSIAKTARTAGVAVVAGDTKVVERRDGGGLTISTAGIGRLRAGIDLAPQHVRPGDRIVVSGCIADHGLAIMATRESLHLDSPIVSDVAPLADLCAALVDCGEGVRFIRDPTRGGLAGVLADIAAASGCTLEVDEATIPIRPATRAAADLLGLDPLAAANEGKLVIACAPATLDAVLAACRADAHGADAAVIGTVIAREPPLVELITAAGGRRIVQRPYGEELPRIC